MAKRLDAEYTVDESGSTSVSDSSGTVGAGATVELVSGARVKGFSKFLVGVRTQDGTHNFDIEIKCIGDDGYVYRTHKEVVTAKAHESVMIDMPFRSIQVRVSNNSITDKTYKVVVVGVN